MTKQERLIVIKHLIAKRPQDFFYGLSENNFNEDQMIDNDLDLELPLYDDYFSVEVSDDTIDDQDQLRTKSKYVEQNKLDKLSK